MMHAKGYSWVALFRFQSLSLQIKIQRNEWLRSRAIRPSIFERCDLGGSSCEVKIDIPAEFTDLVTTLVDLLPVEGEAEP